MTLDNQQIVITGGGGWLGGTLIRALTEGLSECEDLSTPATGLKIRAIALNEHDERHLKGHDADIEVVRGDLLAPADCDRLCEGLSGAILIHLAGLIHPKRTRELFDINYRASQNVINAAAQHDFKRVVAMSSNSPLGCNPHADHLFDETSPYNPYMKYGKSKMLLELFLKEVQAAGNLETVTIRCPWFYGPYQPPRQTLFFEMIRDGKGPIVGSGENKRSMGYLENISQGLIRAAMVPAAAGETYWLADERPYTMNEITDTVERLLETEFDIPCQHKRLRLPGIASEVAKAVDWSLQAVGLYHQKIHVLSEMNKTIACSVDKAKRELGYVPHIALEEGMRRSIRWCVDQGQLGASS